MKPDNVFLAGESRQVKVLDFGISKLGEGNSSLTKTGMVMGTPDYMPPEQAKGLHVDHRADIYAVGAILYRALTGRKPFQEDDQMATLTAVLVQEPPRPRTLNEAIPDGLEVVVQRAMAKEPEERYQTMREFDEALAAFDESGGDPRASVTLAVPEDAEPSERMSWLAGVVRVAQTTTLARGARFARPMIVVASTLGTLWIAGGMTATAQNAITWANGGQELSRVEVWTTVLGAAGALLTPLVLYVRYLGKRVWSSTPRAMAFASRLWQTVVASTASFGLVVLGILLYEGVVSRRPDGVSWPGYPIFTFLFALSVGALVWWFSASSATGKR
jgi:serine/threonine-protein kinase